MVPESKGIPSELTVKTSVPAKKDMVNGSSNLKINNKNELRLFTFTS
jgi:hypothetical protein